MRFFLFLARPARLGAGVDSARFALLTQVGESAEHQLVSPADFPTKSTQLANYTYITISC